MANLPAPKIDLKDATIVLKDGTAVTPNTLTLKMDDGNITFQHSRNVEYILNRGALDGTREGDEIPLSVSFQGRFSEITSSTGLDMSLYEFLTFTGAAASNVSTGADVCEKPYAIDIEVTLARGCTIGADVLQDELIIFPAFRHDTIDGDFKAGQLSIAGKCNVVHPTASRSDPA
jgi:hypothetical protein